MTNINVAPGRGSRVADFAQGRGSRVAGRGSVTLAIRPLPLTRNPLSPKPQPLTQTRPRTRKRMHTHTTPPPPFPTFKNAHARRARTQLKYTALRTRRLRAAGPVAPPSQGRLSPSHASAQPSAPRYNPLTCPGAQHGDLLSPHDLGGGAGVGPCVASSGIVHSTNFTPRLVHLYGLRTLPLRLTVVSSLFSESFQRRDFSCVGPPAAGIRVGGVVSFKFVISSRSESLRRRF